MNKDNVLLDVRELSKSYFKREGLLNMRSTPVFKNISFSIEKGKTLGLIGASGSGKSTLAKIIMRLEASTAGEVLIDCAGVKKAISTITLPAYYKRVQMVFQNPYSALNPQKKIWQIITVPLCMGNTPLFDELMVTARHYAALVGLGEQYLDVYPKALSGGQRQRVGIARALVLEPELLILDESLSALDPSIQAQIINLLIDLQSRFGLTYLFISHDLDLVNYFCDQIVEVA